MSSFDAGAEVRTGEGSARGEIASGVHDSAVGPHDRDGRAPIVQPALKVGTRWGSDDYGPAISYQTSLSGTGTLRRHDCEATAHDLVEPVFDEFHIGTERSG